MSVEVTFHRVTAATLANGEDAWLIKVNRVLAGLLVPADNGWFLQMGLGPYEAEGLIFPDLTDAEAWVRSRVPGS
jgi:hypothetical protein